MQVGYARTSTADQVAGFEAQKRDLIQAGCEEVFSEQVSSVAQRAELDAVLKFVRRKDTLVVTKLDRLARSTQHLLKIVDELEAKGVALRILDFGGAEVDTKSPSGKLMLTMFAAMAQFEREMMLERQREGIAKAKAAGRYKGRTPVPDNMLKQVLSLHARGDKPAKIAKDLSLGRSTVYRLLQREPSRQANHSSTPQAASATASFQRSCSPVARLEDGNSKYQEKVQCEQIKGILGLSSNFLE